MYWAFWLLFYIFWVDMFALYFALAIDPKDEDYTKLVFLISLFWPLSLLLLCGIGIWRLFQIRG